MGVHSGTLDQTPAGVDGTVGNIDTVWKDGGGTGPTGIGFENENNIIGKNVKMGYSYTDASGNNKHYGTYDNSKELESFKPLGLSLVLFLFSVYLFFVATKLYHRYFDKKFNEQLLNVVFYLCSASIIIFWVILVLSVKGIPLLFWTWELVNFPGQFVLGVVLSSLLLLGVGIFRFTIIAFIYNPVDSENVSKDIRFSFIGFIFGILSLVANLSTVFSLFDK